MKAELGKRYAQIIRGHCHWKFDITTLPEWKDDAFQVVDITGMNPEPNEGDLFDGVTFSKPIIPPEVILTKRQRLEQILGMTIDELKLELQR